MNYQKNKKYILKNARLVKQTIIIATYNAKKNDFKNTIHKVVTDTMKRK